MKINPIQISFKSAVEGNVVASTSSAVSNPIQSAQNTPMQPTVTPDYNVRVPQKYTSLGVQELPFATKAHMFKLENGQRVVIIPKKGPTVVKTYVNVGSMNEPDTQRGISHFIEHNLFNGSDGLGAGEFFATVNKMGANTNASTGFAATDYYIESNLLNKSDLETQIKIHSSMLETPKFAVDMIEKEKGPVDSEINMILDDPDNVATNNTLKLLYNIKSTSKDIIGGNVDNINKLTSADVMDYYKRNYYPANMTTVITGEIEPEETMKLLSKYFKSKNVNPKPRNYEKLVPIQKSVRNDLISDKTNSAIVCMGFNGPKNNDTKDKILLDAFQFFLVGSSVARLNKSLQEIQTNAFIASDRISPKPDGNIVILFSTQTSEGNTENAIKRVFDEVADLEKHPPTEEELNIVKKKLKLNLAQVFESSSIVNTVVGTAMLDNNLDSVTNFEKVIDNLTSKDIVDFAKKYFDLNKVAITVVHPETSDLKSINQNYQRVHHPSFSGKVDAANHKEAIDTSKVSEVTLPNNISLVTNDINKDLATFDFSISVDAPANVKPGVSDLLGVMLNKGSKTKDEKKFFTDLEKQGIQTSFNASEREIYVNSMFLPADIHGAMHSAKDVLLNPRFTQEDLDDAKKFIKEKLQSEQKTTKEELFKEMFKGQIYGYSNEDIMKNIDKLTLDDVKGLYKYIMSNASAQVAVSGPFDKNPNFKENVIAELKTDYPLFQPYCPGVFGSYKPVQAKKIVVSPTNKSQAEIQMGYKFKTNSNMKDSITFDMLNIILGGTPSSRLFSDLREKQKLAYQVNSKLGYLDNSGVLALFIKTTTDDQSTGEVSYDNVQKSINGFNQHVAKLVSQPVTSEELESAKLTLKNKILDYSELTADKNRSILIGLKSYYGVSQDNKMLDLIDSITPEDIRSAAEYIFKTNPTISILATKDTINSNMPYLKTLGDVVS